MKYDANGQKNWSQTHAVGGTPSGGRSVNADAAGNVYVTGVDGLRTFKYAP